MIYYIRKIATMITSLDRCAIAWFNCSPTQLEMYYLDISTGYIHPNFWSSDVQPYNIERRSWSI